MSAINCQINGAQNYGQTIIFTIIGWNTTHYYIPEKRKFSGILCFRQQRSRRRRVVRRRVVRHRRVVHRRRVTILSAR